MLLHWQVTTQSINAAALTSDNPEYQCSCADKWQPRISMLLHFQPRVSMLLHWEPRVSMLLHCQPKVSIILHRQPRVSILLHCRPRVSMIPYCTDNSGVSVLPHFQFLENMPAHWHLLTTCRPSHPEYQSFCTANPSIDAIALKTRSINAIALSAQSINACAYCIIGKKRLYYRTVCQSKWMLFYFMSKSFSSGATKFLS